MKTIQEQIAVLRHFAAGGKVETRSVLVWVLDPNPSWNWYMHDYRIVEEVDPYAELKAAVKDPTKQVKIKCWSNWVNPGHQWSWNFPPEQYEIRDMPKPMKKVKLLAWFDGKTLFWHTEGDRTYSAWKRVPSEDKEIEVEDE